MSLRRNIPYPYIQRTEKEPNWRKYSQNLSMLDGGAQDMSNRKVIGKCIVISIFFVCTYNKRQFLKKDANLNPEYSRGTSLILTVLSIYRKTV